MLRGSCTPRKGPPDTLRGTRRKKNSEERKAEVSPGVQAGIPGVRASPGEPGVSDPAR